MNKTIIACAFNEEENIPIFWKAMLRHMKKGDELLLVNDGSTDNTLAEMENAAKHDSRIKAINIPLNRGKNLVLPKLAFRKLKDIVVTIDCDLEDEINNLSKMIKLVEKSYFDVLVGERYPRTGSFSKLLMSKIYNNFHLLFGLQINDANCGLKVFKKEVFENACRVLDRKTQYRFITLICFLNGYKVSQYKILHQRRFFGKSKYGLRRTFYGLIDLMELLFNRRKFIFRW